MDSVVGAFCTQAVSDVQSSTTFMNLAATWPARPSCDSGGMDSTGELASWYLRGAVGGYVCGYLYVSVNHS